MKSTTRALSLSGAQPPLGRLRGSHRRSLPLSLVLLAALALSSAPALAARTLEPEKVLVLGPQAVPLPAFYDGSTNAFRAEEALAVPWVDASPLTQAGPPRAGGKLPWAGGTSLSWSVLPAGQTLGDGGAGDGLAVAYVAVYLEARRFLTADLTIDSPVLLEARLGAEEVATKKTDGDGQAKASLSLERGKHLLLLKLVSDGAALAANMKLDVPEGFEDDLGFSLVPEHGVSLDDGLEAESITGVDLSPDGALVAIHLRRPGKAGKEGEADSRESRTEIRRVSDRELVRTLHTGESSFQWLSDGSAYSYVVAKDELSDLWVAPIAADGASKGPLERVVQGMKAMGDYQWLPDGKSVVVAVGKEAEKDDRGVKRYRALDDRWTTWRDHDHLLQVDRSGASQRPLTAGPGDISLQDVSPDGKRVLFAVSVYEPTARPFSFDDLFELELASLKTTLLKRVAWFGGASYGPGGFRVLVRAGASAFGKLGHAVQEDTLPNEYDSQLYLINLASGEVSTLSRSFDPAVEDALWMDSGALVVQAQTGSRKLLYRYQPGRGFSRLAENLESSVEVVDGFSVARRGGAVAFYGSSVDKPHRVLVQQLEGSAAPHEIYLPDADRWSRARWGKVEDFEVKLAVTTEVADPGLAEVEHQEKVLPGRLHYPADFDPTKSYPLIVYYYGGTVPSERSFGGRWPFNAWTSQGYVVYIPQPSGAIGYGQERSALHVNNWGRTVGNEIISGTRAVLAAHPFLDAKRVGCLGASYGGFMTMYLLTQTDLFAGAISHAGISSLSSYWGEGWWGYLYSAVASSGSYPWNAQDLYVGQSPLFQADKIVTPLLLFHGTADTNVPIGESQQMYTALEILGKDVEFVTFDGENHRIADPAKKKIWSETILAYFDWKLKGQEEWWKHLYGDEAKPRG